MTFRNRVFLTFSVLLIIPFFISGYFMQSYYFSLKNEEVYDNHNKMIVQLNNSLDLIIGDASRSSLGVLFNPQLLQILRKYSNQESYLKTTKDDSYLSSYLASVVYDKEYIQGATIITKNNHIFSSLDKAKVKDYYSVSQLTWYETALQFRGNWRLVYDDSLQYYLKRQQGMMSLVRLLRDPNTSEELGVIKFDFQNTYMAKIFEPIMAGDFLLTERNGVILFKSENANETGCVTNKKGISDRLCISYTSKDTGITTAYAISKSYLQNDIVSLSRITIIYIILSLVCSFIVSYIVVNRLLKPLMLLKEHISNYQFKQRLNLSPKVNELEAIKLAYDGLLVEIDTLVADVYDASKRYIEMEYKALQAQMDPHFLFNTLEAINMKALSHHDFEISDMVVELGKIVRYRIKGDVEQIPLRDEVEFSKSFVSIMKLRMGKQLIITWSIEEVLLSYMVPKYIIQPLIENAIIHGFTESKEYLHVHVVIETEEEQLLITVSDNGVGITSERFQMIQENIYLSSKETISSDLFGIALRNIHKRIQFMYGDGYGLYISSKLCEGTVVLLRIEKRVYSEKNIIG